VIGRKTPRKLADDQGGVKHLEKEGGKLPVRRIFTRV